jgi:outer membrane protein
MRMFHSVAFLALLALNVENAAAQSALSPATALPKDPGSQTPGVFPADAHIGYVDVERVAAISSEGKAANARLNDLRTRKSAELAERNKQIQALQNRLSQSEAVLNDTARTQLQRQLQRAQVDLQRSTEDAQSEVQTLQQETYQVFTAQLFPLIQQVAKEKKIWAVFGNESGLLWSDPAIDLSDEVAKRLDATVKK